MSMPGARSAACSTIFSTTRSTTFWTSTSRMTSWVTTFSTWTSLMVSTGTSLITSLVTTVSTGTSFTTSLVTIVSTGTSFTTSLTSVTVTVTVFSTTSASPHAARAATPTPPASAAAPPRSSLRRLKDLLGPIDIPLPCGVTRACTRRAYYTTHAKQAYVIPVTGTNSARSVRPRPCLRIERLAQPVSEQIDRQHRDGNGQAVEG